MAPRPRGRQRPRHAEPSRVDDQHESGYSAVAHVQAYESQLVYGQQGDRIGASASGPRGRDGLIRWDGTEAGDEEIWLDR
jgi:hypothetical protein